jgi:hypothetical protein
LFSSNCFHFISNIDNTYIYTSLVSVNSGVNMNPYNYSIFCLILNSGIFQFITHNISKQNIIASTYMMCACEFNISEYQTSQIIPIKPVWCMQPLQSTLTPPVCMLRIKIYHLCNQLRWNNCKRYF